MGLGSTVSRRGSGTIHKAARTAAAVSAAANVVAHVAKKMVSSGTQSKSGGSEGGIVTSQYNSRVAYSKKRPGKGTVKRQERQRKFARKVIKAMDVTLPKLKVLFSQPAYGAAAANLQGLIGDEWLLNGHVTGIIGSRDLTQIEYNMGSSDTVPKKIQMLGCTMEVSVKNTGSYPLFLELYDFIAIRDTAVADSTPISVFGAGLNTATISTCVTPNTATVGVTPFHSLKFCQNFKIFKKTIIKLGVGESCDFIRTSKRKFILDAEKWKNTGCKKGITRGTMGLVYGENDASGGTTAASWSVSTQRTYNVTCPGFNSGSTNVMAA